MHIYAYICTVRELRVDMQICIHAHVHIYALWGSSDLLPAVLIGICVCLKRALLIWQKPPIYMANEKRPIEISIPEACVHTHVDTCTLAHTREHTLHTHTLTHPHSHTHTHTHTHFHPLPPHTAAGKAAVGTASERVEYGGGGGGL